MLMLKYMLLHTEAPPLYHPVSGKLLPQPPVATAITAAAATSAGPTPRASDTSGKGSPFQPRGLPGDMDLLEEEEEEEQEGAVPAAAAVAAVQTPVGPVLNHRLSFTLDFLEEPGSQQQQIVVVLLGPFKAVQGQPVTLTWQVRRLPNKQQLLDDGLGPERSSSGGSGVGGSGRRGGRGPVRRSSFNSGQQQQQQQNQPVQGAKREGGKHVGFLETRQSSGGDEIPGETGWSGGADRSRQATPQAAVASISDEEGEDVLSYELHYGADEKVERAEKAAAGRLRRKSIAIGVDVGRSMDAKSMRAALSTASFGGGSAGPVASGAGIWDERCKGSGRVRLARGTGSCATIQVVVVPSVTGRLVPPRLVLKGVSASARKTLTADSSRNMNLAADIGAPVGRDQVVVVTKAQQQTAMYEI